MVRDSLRLPLCLAALERESVDVEFVVYTPPFECWEHEQVPGGRDALRSSCEFWRHLSRKLMMWDLW